MKPYNPVIKIAVPAVKNVSAEQFNEALETHAVAVQNETTCKRMLEQELDEVKQKYMPKLTCLEFERNSAYGVIATYCQEQKKTMFAHRRSIGTPYGIVGFRLGTPRLRVRKGYSQKAVLELLAAKLPEYVRTTIVPAKNMLVAHRHTEKVVAHLHDAGLEIVQNDVFYIHKPTPQALTQTA